MTFQKVERLPLDRFADVRTTSWTPVRGTYLFPLRILEATDRSNDPNDYLEVIRVIDVHDIDVAVTRGGGFYIRCAEDYQDPDEDMQRYVETLNLITCEISLEGHFARPVTDYDVGPAKLIGRHIGAVGGGGWFAETHWQPFALLAAEPHGDMWAANSSWFLVDPPGLLDRVSELRNIRALTAVSSDLPVLVCAAVYHAARHNIAEAITTSWFSCEILLSYWWDEYLATLQGQQLSRLKDTRTYTAAVRTEMLLATGRMERGLYEHLNRARQVRNNLAHRGRAELSGAQQAMAALKATLTTLGINADRIGWSSGSSGLGGPSLIAEPEFPFRRFRS
jgi:hypothetical protein